jgi:cephalosporin hydroxylase
MTTRNSWHESVPDGSEFDLEKRTNLEIMAKDLKHRETGLNLLSDVSEYGFGHKNTWMGVPIIRLPEDLILQQEIIWSEKPDLIIEIGIARGGGLVYNASLQEICGVEPNVVGVDNKIFKHTHTAIANNRFNPCIKLVEGDSISREVTSTIQKIVSSSKKTLLILDSDHSSDHVLNELRCYVPLLPIYSIIMVCDTLIDEYPEGTYVNRTWSDGKGPLDAIMRFRAESNTVEPFMENESRALILSEIRDGLLKKVSN